MPRPGGGARAARHLHRAARRRSGALDHVLIFGPRPGQDHLSHVIANELGVNLRTTSGPVIERAGDLAAPAHQPAAARRAFRGRDPSPLAGRRRGAVPAMEDFQIDIMIGEGPAARLDQLDLPPFTLIGATTRTACSPAPARPLRHRAFAWSSTRPRNWRRSCDARRRSSASLRSAGGGGSPRRSRGTPRIANRLLRRARLRRGARRRHHHLAAAQAAMDMLKIDPRASMPWTGASLTTIVDSFEGGPVGVESLAAALSEARHHRGTCLSPT